MTRLPAETADARRSDLAWVDWVKAIALAWIVLNHVVERIFGYPFIANPNPEWPPLSDRVGQLAPLTGLGAWTVPVNLVRYLGWSGDQGVQLFLIVSGFGLTWGLLQKRSPVPLPVGAFYRRRAERIYPLWWGIHLLFVSSWLLVGWGMAVTDPALYLSMLGIRVTPGLFYYFAPAWWYVGLLLQLYLVYPLLWNGLRRRGPGWLLAVSCLAGFGARAAGLLFFEGYLDAWQRGAVFITRLPEFVLGMSLAAYFHRDTTATHRVLRAPTTLLLALAAYMAGTVLALTLPGMTVAPFLLGAGALGLLYPWLSRRRAGGVASSLARWAGQHSYSLYLAHHPFVMVLVPEGSAGPLRAVAGAATAIVVTIVAALALERGVDVVKRLTVATWRKVGWRGLVVRLGTLAATTLLSLLAVEYAVRYVAPQEVLGWGERPSLEPDARFGWRLKPSRQSRLRWEGYDYRVTANSLGFPGPEYAVDAAPGTLRILATGDAFTSAEGVDTDQAWPRRLEADLATRLGATPVEVLNFAITGYGPAQYAAVVEAFAPKYRPRLILVEMYLNDFQDVLVSDDEFREQIGFGLPEGDSAAALLRLEHLRSFARWRVAEPVKAWFRRRPDPRGYFLAGFSTLERRPVDEQEHAQREVTKHLERIARVATDVGAEVAVLIVPAPAQVCNPSQLAYYPNHVALADTSRFDPEGPRQATERIAHALGFRFIDLAPVLSAVPGGCPYNPGNLHWLAVGHDHVAAYLAAALTAPPDRPTE